MCLRWIVAVTLVTLAGCGEGSSLQAFIDDLVAACATVNDDLPKASNEAEAATVVRGFVSKAEDLVAATPDGEPPGDTKYYDSLTKEMGEAADNLDEAHALRVAGNDAEADAAKAQADQNVAAADEAAEQYGFPVHMSECRAYLESNSASPSG